MSTDISENPTVHYKLNTDACQLSFKNNSIDIIVSQELLKYLPLPRNFFHEA
ncbi:MAG: methyltransferase domain-containing protein [Candidatus Hodarchaeota archaeon]